MLETFYRKTGLEAGCDEAGRGCLAGPVTAAAVIWPKKLQLPELDDSKKLSKEQRNELRAIIEKNAIAYSVVFNCQRRIDEINILKASIEGMHRALHRLPKKPKRLLIDGHIFYPFHDIPHHCIIKGDGKYASIAAASILAKTYRDEYMEAMHNRFPYYEWITNKGYPTAAHREALYQYGPSPLHRRSFRWKPLPEQLEFFADKVPTI